MLIVQKCWNNIKKKKETLKSHSFSILQSDHFNCPVFLLLFSNMFYSYLVA